jgi:RNAse (barnase) inhibitor barstar
MFLHLKENSFSQYIHSKTDTITFIINGDACDDKFSFYETISQALNLPDYFGKNLDALEEILFDLDFIDQTYCQIIIFNYSHLMANEPDYKQALQELLESIDSEFLEIILIP